MCIRNALLLIFVSSLLSCCDEGPSKKNGLGAVDQSHDQAQLARQAFLESEREKVEFRIVSSLKDSLLGTYQSVELKNVGRNAVEVKKISINNRDDCVLYPIYSDGSHKSVSGFNNFETFNDFEKAVVGLSEVGNDQKSINEMYDSKNDRKKLRASTVVMRIGDSLSLSGIDDCGDLIRAVVSTNFGDFEISE